MFTHFLVFLFLYYVGFFFKSMSRLQELLTDLTPVRDPVEAMIR